VLLERLLAAPRGLEGREQLDVTLTLRRGFRRAWTMHLAGVSTLRPSAVSARAYGAWTLSLRKKEARHRTRGGTARLSGRS
jgi:hypothetical protein